MAKKVLSDQLFLQIFKGTGEEATVKLAME